MPSALPPAPQAEFVPIAPCRYLDTRSEGGAFGSTTVRTYPRRCGVPAYARTLAVSISAVTPTGNGFLQAGSAGGPTTTVVNYTRSESITTGAQVPVSAAGIRLLNRGGPTHVTLDVTGYYQPPMYAYIDGGALAVSSRALSVDDTPTQVIVTFDRDVTYCDIQVTGRTVGSIVNATGSFDTVRVQVTGTAARYFYLRVTC